jgi:hypothetical protein
MAGLSDIHLFTGWELNGNPINMHILDTLETSLKDKPFSFTPSSEPQCGTVEMKLDQEQWDNIFNTLKEQSDLLELRRYKAEELSKEINRYLERKCEEYCEKNNINFIQWSQFGAYRHKDNAWEVYYMGELVCGARLNFELVEGATETNISLELY